MPSTGFEGVVGYPTQAESVLREEFRAVGGQQTAYSSSIPLGAWTRLTILAWAGGGGGSSGVIGATGAIRKGGIGGGGGGYSREELVLTPQLVAALNAFTILVGQGGLGGGPGSNIGGGDGGASGVYVNNDLSSANYLILVSAGLGSGSGGSGAVTGVSSTVASATGSTGPNGTVNATGTLQTACPGGAAGGGRTSAGTNSGGGSGSVFTNGPAFQATNGAINAGVGGDGFDQILGSYDWPGTSGGGGGSATGTPGSGGKGGFPGAGGGGGGAGTTAGSAKGGDGGDGFVVLVWS